MLNMTACEKILNEAGKRYTRDQIREIREFLYFVGGLQIENNQLNTN